MLPRPTLAVRKSHKVNPLAPLIKATQRKKGKKKKKRLTEWNTQARWAAPVPFMTRE
jgi:hypothetical protein